MEETQKHVCDPKRMKAGDKAGTSPSKKQLQDILYKANKGDKHALLKLIKGWNHKAGIGTNARTPEEIAAGNKRVVDNLIKGGKILLEKFFPSTISNVSLQEKTPSQVKMPIGVSLVFG